MQPKFWQPVQVEGRPYLEQTACMRRPHSDWTLVSPACKGLVHTEHGLGEGPAGVAAPVFVMMVMRRERGGGRGG